MTSVPRKEKVSWTEPPLEPIPDDVEFQERRRRRHPDYFSRVNQSGYNNLSGPTILEDFMDDLICHDCMRQRHP